MKFKFVDGTEVILAEGTNTDAFLVLRYFGTMARDVLKLFLDHGYDMSVIPGEFLKIFTAKEREIGELASVLNEIDERGLKEVFNANLETRTFKRSFLRRVKDAMDRGIPFVNSDNTFIRELRYEEMYVGYASYDGIENTNASYVKDISNENGNEQVDNSKTLDMEDTEVKVEIIKVLNQIAGESQDFTVSLLTTNIIANLDKAILENNKRYKTEGIRSVVASAIKNMDLSLEEKNILNNNVLAAFQEESQRKVG